MRSHICTILDKGFLFRGNALYESLLATTEDFCLYVLCTDLLSAEVLQKMDRGSLKIIMLEDVERRFPELLSVKEGRNISEYSWTLKAFLCRYILELFEAPHIIFSDADIYFFRSAQEVVDACSAYSIAIMPHNFTPNKKYLEAKMGVFNAGFAYFSSDARAAACLEWWSERVIEWCFVRYENGKSGDQMYLNEWPTLFENVGVITHTGIDAAPWNIGNYRVSYTEGAVLLNDQPLVAFHFHGFLMQRGPSFLYSHRTYIPSRVRRLIYTPYEDAIRSSIAHVQDVYPEFSWGYKPISYATRAYMFLLSFLPIRKTLEVAARLRNRAILAKRI